MSRFSRLEKFSLNFPSPSFEIRVNLLHPYPTLFLYGSLLSRKCFSIVVKYYFQVFLNLKTIFCVAKITHGLSFFNVVLPTLVLRLKPLCLHSLEDFYLVIS